MKRLLTSAAMFLCSLLTFAQFSGSGSGTESDPYLIFNPIQLDQLRNFINKEGVYFKLMADINLTDFLEDENPSQGWQPVGTTSSPFKGVFDGNGKIISGLWINRSGSEYVGLFGCTNGATIKNLTIKGLSVKGKSYVSLLTAHSTSTTISNCSLSASLFGGTYVGGCVGWGNSNTITAISSDVEVLCSDDYAGGIIGYVIGVGSITEGRITSNSISGNNKVGGVCGYCQGAISINNCYVHSSINGNDDIGGISGFFSAATRSVSFIGCLFVGSIMGNSYVGGIVGSVFMEWSDRNISKCGTIGTIHATGDYIGGIIGHDHETSDYRLQPYKLSDNYFSGTIVGGNYVGGIVGEKYKGSISNCYSHATIAGTKYVGGVFGYASGNQKYNFYARSNVANNSYIKSTDGGLGRIYGGIGNYSHVEETGNVQENKALNQAVLVNAGVSQEVNDDGPNGTGVSLTKLKLKATYVAMGWDFNDIWEIQETECFPYFKTQTAPPYNYFSSCIWCNYCEWQMYRRRNNHFGDRWGKEAVG